MNITFKLTEGGDLIALGTETEVKNLIINDLVLVENGVVSQQAQDLVNSLDDLTQEGELRQLN
jgi:hypothetical protein|tara:strand:- start:971 stop:1159 length:189 start_codon:yes stop_codon:yes gene_type:complete